MGPTPARIAVPADDSPGVFMGEWSEALKWIPPRQLFRRTPRRESACCPSPNRLALPDGQLYCQPVRKPLAAARTSLAGGCLSWLTTTPEISPLPPSTAPAR